MTTVFFAMPNGRFDLIFPQPVLDEIRSRYSLVDLPTPDVADESYVTSGIGEAEIVITSWGSPSIGESVLNAAPRLELIVHAAGSVRPIVTDAIWERGVRVTSSANAIAEGVAEFCLGLTLTCTKRAFWYALQTRLGYWPKGDDAFGPPFEIYRQNVGLIGAGYVGRLFAEHLKRFGCNVLLYDPYCSKEVAESLDCEVVASLDELFTRSRVVSLHAPVTDETKGMIRGSHFARLPTGALFINTARGVIVREAEMIEELRKGRFIACLDVTDPEPPLIDSPLRTLPNVLLTPHEAGSIVENRRRIGEFALAEIDRFTGGESLEGEVTKDRLTILA